ncbi:MAG: hypothetical protein JNK23_02215 [Opitutaceae bacterium]|nr:hypothetical protein [Opitutaceae bacterium]
MIPLKKFSAIAVAAAALAWLPGCLHPYPSVADAARLGPFYAPGNFAGDESLGIVRRVVLMPVWVGQGTSPESVAALDEVVLATLQRENRFEIVPFSREDCRRRYVVDALSSSTALPADLLEMLKREYAVDAVLFVDVTAYQAYKPLVLGLRGKLAAIDGSRLMWTFDNVFASDDPAVANSARRFFVERDRSVPTDLTAAVLQSPSKFATYAASTMFSTLPPVLAPRVASRK